MEGLITARTLAAKLADIGPMPPKPLRYWAQQAAEARELEDFIKVNAHDQRQAARVAELRSELDAVIRPRLEEEIASRLAEFELDDPAAKESYAVDYRQFRKWCAETGVSCLPAAPEAIAVFLIEVCSADDVLEPAALATRYCRAITLRHLVVELPDPIESPAVAAVLRWTQDSGAQSLAADAPPDETVN